MFIHHYGIFTDIIQSWLCDKLHFNCHCRPWWHYRWWRSDDSDKQVPTSSWVDWWWRTCAWRPLALRGRPRRSTSPWSPAWSPLPWTRCPRLKIVESVGRGSPTAIVSGRSSTSFIDTPGLQEGVSSRVTLILPMTSIMLCFKGLNITAAGLLGDFKPWCQQ